MAADGYPSREDRIVAEFGDGLDVEGIAFRYGLTVAQVYVVVEREVGPADQALPTPCPPPGYYAPPPAGPQDRSLPPPGPGFYGPPAYQAQPPPPEPYAPPAGYGPPGHAGPGQGYQPSQGSPAEEAIVAEYGEGQDVEGIARKYGINVERVYEIVQRIVGDDPRPPTGPPSAW